jgi:hypothetical protein
MPPIPESEPNLPRAERPPLTRAQVRLYIAGYAVLVGGTAASAWAFRNAAKHDAGNPLVAGLNDTKKSEYQLELYGGKANVLAADIQQGFTGLWHGRHLAYTLATLTFAVALALFFIAFFLPDFPPPHEDAAGSGNQPKK